MKFFLLLFTLFIVLNLNAQNLLEIQRIATPIVLDGKVDEPAWKTISPFPMTMFIPIEHGKSI